jgi:hypothetical protein
MKNFATLFHLRSALDQFNAYPDFSKHPDYLKQWLERVEQNRVMYTARSTDARLSPRLRARNRDLEQNALGIIAGIKFSLAYMEAPEGLLQPEVKNEDSSNQ